MNETIMSQGTKLEGNISSKVNLIIFGDVEGIIETSESVKLEEGCNVVGKINAKTLIVKGEFNGDADCTTVDIRKGGKFIGNIKSQILIIDSKGAFEGKSERKDDNNTIISSKKKPHKELDTDNILL